MGGIAIPFNVLLLVSVRRQGTRSRARPGLSWLSVEAPHCPSRGLAVRLWLGVGRPIPEPITASSMPSPAKAYPELAGRTPRTRTPRCGANPTPAWVHGLVSSGCVLVMTETRLLKGVLTPVDRNDDRVHRSDTRHGGANPRMPEPVGARQTRIHTPLSAPRGTTSQGRAERPARNERVGRATGLKESLYSGAEIF